MTALPELSMPAPSQLCSDLCRTLVNLCIFNTISCQFLDFRINIRADQALGYSIALVEACNVWDAFCLACKINERPTSRGGN
jgi:hypothetical protein